IMAESPVVGDVRGLGMLLAVELVADKASKASFPPSFMANEKIRLQGLKHGVMLYARPTPGSAHGHWFMVAPPLTITESETAELLRRTRAAVDGFRDEAAAAGLI
ncbi:MAG: aspartate aminotransferase family protein, partial [Alphaproteobacteria bacterium]